MFEYIHFYLVTVLFFVLVQQNCSVSKNYRPPDKKITEDADSKVGETFEDNSNPSRLRRMSKFEIDETHESLKELITTMYSPVNHVPHIDEDLNVKRVSELVSDNSYLKEVLNHIIVPRVVGTANHSAVIKYITNELHNLGWDVEIDNFMDRTPLGMKSFNNIIATPNKYATQYLDLACHLDSKKYDDIVFYGATDSAVPCAMMMQIAYSFNEYLKKSKNKELSLRLIFFDGEEAFVRWSATDSIYGARHLAEHWASTPATELGPGFNQLHRMNLLVLLDLLGTPNPKFYNFFSETLDAYRMLVHAQSKLKEKGMIHPYAKYFNKKSTIDRIEDDHLPFIQRGVPVVHIIPVPFPRQWHTEYDNYDAIDFPTVNNLVKILSLFVIDYLGLELYP